MRAASLGLQAAIPFDAIRRRSYAASLTSCKPASWQPDDDWLQPHVQVHMGMRAVHVMCIGSAPMRRFRRFNPGHQPVIWWRSADGRVRRMGGGLRPTPCFCARGPKEKSVIKKGRGARCVFRRGGKRTEFRVSTGRSRTGKVRFALRCPPAIWNT